MTGIYPGFLDDPVERAVYSLSSSVGDLPTGEIHNSHPKLGDLPHSVGTCISGKTSGSIGGNGKIRDLRDFYTDS